MTDPTSTGERPVALVTGAARRLGAAIARALHGAGYDLCLHYHTSRGDAEQVAAGLEHERAGSTHLVSADLRERGVGGELVGELLAWRNRLDVLVNNASSFFPTPIGEATDEHWDDLVGTNLRAPFFISQAAAPALERAGGSIVNMADIHAARPIEDHPIYCAAKAGLVSLTRSMARDLAPRVRVNAIAPGAIIWPESGPESDGRDEALARIPLGTIGTPEEIARAVLYFAHADSYVTGQVLAVDGGRSQT